MGSKSSSSDKDKYQNSIEQTARQKDKCQDDPKDNVNNGTFGLWFHSRGGVALQCPKISRKKKKVVKVISMVTPIKPKKL